MFRNHTSPLSHDRKPDFEPALNISGAFHCIVAKTCMVWMVVCSIYLVVPQPVFSQSVPTFRVVGRVVDERGNGLPGVGISISPAEYPELWTSPYSGEQTDENGNFSIEGLGNTAALWKSQWFLYTRMRSAMPGFSPIDPPFFRSLQIADNQFEGIPFLPAGKTQVDVGDVRVKFHYGNLRVVAPADSSPPVSWDEVMISVHHPAGGEVAASTLSKNDRNAFVKPNGDLIMSLPTGKWKIEIMNLDHDKVLFTSEYADVSPDRLNTAFLKKKD